MPISMIMFSSTNGLQSHQISIHYLMGVVYTDANQHQNNIIQSLKSGITSTTSKIDKYHLIWANQHFWLCIVAAINDNVGFIE